MDESDGLSFLSLSSYGRLICLSFLPAMMMKEKTSAVLTVFSFLSHGRQVNQVKEENLFEIFTRHDQSFLHQLRLSS